jgi:hypothetical protein
MFKDGLKIVIANITVSAVGIATRYGLGGPRIESRRRRNFRQLSRPALGPTQPVAQWVPQLFSGDETLGVWRLPPTPSSVEVKERVDIYLYFLSEPSWQVIG